MKRGMAYRRAEGFTIIELLVVVVIIGVIAAIAIPTLLNAIDRGKQKRTMVELRSIGSAVEAYCVDFNLFPITTDLGVLAANLERDYITTVMRYDSWGNAILFEGSGLRYTVGSTGKNGGGSLTLLGTGGETGDFDDDIIYSNGLFVQWPQGQQD